VFTCIVYVLTEGCCYKPVPTMAPVILTAGHLYMPLHTGARWRVVRSWHRTLPASKQSTLLYV